MAWSYAHVSNQDGEVDIDAAVKRGMAGDTIEARTKAAVTATEQATQDGKKNKANSSEYEDPDCIPTSKYDPSKAQKPLDQFRRSNDKRRGVPKPLRAAVRDERAVHESAAKVFDQLIRGNQQIRKDLDKLFKKVAKLERKTQWIEDMIDETRMDTTEFKTDLSQELEGIQADVMVQLSQVELANDQLLDRIEDLGMDGGAPNRSGADNDTPGS